ncbi:MAG: hydroxyacid dehydrogenase [Bacteroidetes bacterium GWF2_49_14]|nr:MAG: hydroxyacid dehydrogenase [Bacteroidetes bacterium GWF2_49_14]HBB93084.1 hydroxyacid dehydrogenase [Bacteroidales bacterium]
MKNGEIIIYRSPEGNAKIDVKLIDETVWLTQKQLAELYNTTPQNITLHLKNIYQEGELQADATCKDFLQVQKEGRRTVQRSLTFYNLDVIISVGYRVKSAIATQFRIWATNRLKEYIIKGFVLDDERLKLARNNYFDELLSRIRDIRSSEKMFYRKVCEIYATSADYDPGLQKTLDFFAIVQNKFHWAVTGQTAAEILFNRADAAKPNMGLTNWPGESIKKQDIEVAKNYLNPEELDQLNRLVNQYLEFAELQAMNRKVMYMDDWITKLHGFLTLNEKQILTDAGHVSAILAKEHVHREYDKYQKMIVETEPDEFDKAIRKLEHRTNPGE